MKRIPPELLQRISFLSDLSPGALDLVADRMIHRSVPAHTILFRKGESARGVYLLTRGRVEIYRSTADGREQVLHTETAVQSVAELPLFDGGEYPASGRTAEDSELFFLSLEDFQRLYREHPEIADTVIQALGRRLRTLVRLVEKISLKNVPSRVARAILDVGEAAGALGEGDTFVLERTQSELAQELATTRESVARALGELRRRGIISTRGRRITIRSLRGLEEAARGEEPRFPVGPEPT